ncbi:MAG: HD domain-containing protein [Longimicrobiales bacterium]|nr:HD domain-containing protein [Longimicrobiales bacterium]
MSSRPRSGEGATGKAPGGVVVRDPLWGTIGLDATARAVVDSAAFQRLRYIRQLGLAHLVYPGATHTRFDHALGVYHLMRRAIEGLAERGALEAVDPVERRLVPLAGLLHDVGHYPFSHALEELEEPLIPGHHESLTGRFLRDPDVRAALESVAEDGVERVEALIRGRSDSPLQGLVSGSLDLDKVEYLKRDAMFCGVPYGEVDVDRLLGALMVLEGDDGPEIGVHEKGVAALESLLFAKYQMFRNVYWHHAVRAGTVLYKRIVFDALEAGLIEADELVGKTDEALLFMLAERAADRQGDGARIAGFVDALQRRRLPKRGLEVVAADLGVEPGAWAAADTPLKRRLEDRMAVELRLPPGSVFLDYPEKPGMFRLDLLVHRRTGEVLRLGARGRAGLIGLPGVADELYRTARVLRVFTLGGRRRIAREPLARLVALSETELEQRLEKGTPLLA